MMSVKIHILHTSMHAMEKNLPSFRVQGLSDSAKNTSVLPILAHIGLKNGIYIGEKIEHMDFSRFFPH